MDQTAGIVIRRTRLCDRYFSALWVRRHVLIGYHPAAGESNYFAGVGDTWGEERVIKRIVKRITEVTPRPVRWIVGGVINVNPCFRCTPAHIAHNLLVR